VEVGVGIGVGVTVGLGIGVDVGAGVAVETGIGVAVGVGIRTRVAGGAEVGESGVGFRVPAFCVTPTLVEGVGIGEWVGVGANVGAVCGDGAAGIPSSDGVGSVGSVEAKPGVEVAVGGGVTTVLTPDCWVLPDSTGVLSPVPVLVVQAKSADMKTASPKSNRGDRTDVDQWVKRFGVSRSIEVPPRGGMLLRQRHLDPCGRPLGGAGHPRPNQGRLTL